LDQLILYILKKGALRQLVGYGVQHHGLSKFVRIYDVFMRCRHQ